MQTKLVKENAINLYGLIRDIKNSNLSREALVKYIMLTCGYAMNYNQKT